MKVQMCARTRVSNFDQSVASLKSARIYKTMRSQVERSLQLSLIFGSRSVYRFGVERKDRGL